MGGRLCRFIFLFVLLLGFIASGCQKAEEASDDHAVTPDPSTLSNEENGDALGEEAVPVALVTAKEGFAAAFTVAQRRAPDAVFVAASGTIAADGTSEAWRYSFDSRQRAKGYDVLDGVVRERQFSFLAPLGEWIDSPAVAKVCGGGDATLERGRWTVVTEKGICELDAATGEPRGE
jgi:hypothetical protein